MTTPGPDDRGRHDEPPSDESSAGSGGGGGAVLGFGSVIAAGVLALAIVSVGEARIAAPIFVLALVVAIYFGRRTPGFLRGVAWAFGVAALVFTACVALVVSAFR